MRIIICIVLGGLGLAGCVSNESKEAETLSRVHDDDGDCELLETFSNTRSYVFNADLLTPISGRSSKRRVDDDMEIDMKNKAAKVPGANAYRFRWVDDSDWSVTAETDVLYCLKFDSKEKDKTSLG